MSFHDVLFPTAISLGAEAGPGWGTIVQATASGHEYRVARQATGRHRYRVSKPLLSAEELSELKDFIAGRRGSLHSFRFKDWTDYSTDETGTGTPSTLDMVLGTGDGTTTQFQLYKHYDQSGPAPYSRAITLPVSGSVVAALDGVTTTAFTVSTTSGIVTFSSAPANGVVITAGCQFDVPVRFGAQVDEWMRATASTGLLFDWQGIDLVEVLSEVELPELWYPGGASELITTGNDQTITFGTVYWPFAATAAIDVYLPAPDRAVGGEHFVVENHSTATNTLTLRDDAGNAVSSALPSSSRVRVALVPSGASASWISYA